MKRIALVGLSILCLSLAATTSAKAETRIQHLSMSTATIDSDPNPKLTPFNLVSLAYQGEYRMQGIPGFGSFKAGISSEIITAKVLVKAAVEAKQLTPGTQNDRGYLNAVEQQLSITR